MLPIVFQDTPSAKVTARIPSKSPLFNASSCCSHTLKLLVFHIVNELKNKHRSPAIKVSQK